MQRSVGLYFHSPVKAHRILRPTVNNQRKQLSSLQARPLSWELPEHLFPRPETFFPRPERLLDGDTFRDLILKQGEAVKEFPWEYIIFFAIVTLIIAELIVKPFDNNGEESSANSADPETRLSPVKKEFEKENRAVTPTRTDEEEMIYALKKIQFQEEQNRSLAILGGVAALALWMAGFLNTPHPFYP